MPIKFRCKLEMHRDLIIECESFEELDKVLEKQVEESDNSSLLNILVKDGDFHYTITSQMTDVAIANMNKNRTFAIDQFSLKDGLFSEISSSTSSDD